MKQLYHLGERFEEYLQYVFGKRRKLLANILKIFCLEIEINTATLLATTFYLFLT
jgi:hypothetical protein